MRPASASTSFELCFEFACAWRSHILVRLSGYMRLEIGHEPCLRNDDEFTAIALLLTCGDRLLPLFDVQDHEEDKRKIACAPIASDRQRSHANSVHMRMNVSSAFGCDELNSPFSGSKFSILQYSDTRRIEWWTQLVSLPSSCR